MSKEGAKIVKFVAKKKVNRYNKEECLKEIERMQVPVSDNHKSGIQKSSKYYKTVVHQLNTL